MVKLAAISSPLGPGSVSGSGSSSVSAKRQASLSAFLTPQPHSKKTKLIPSTISNSPSRASARAKNRNGTEPGMESKPFVIDGDENNGQDGHVFSSPLDKGKGKEKAEPESSTSTTPKNTHPLFGSSAQCSRLAQPQSLPHSSSIEQVPYPKLDLSDPWPPKGHPYHLPPSPTYNHPIVLPPLPHGLRDMKYNSNGRPIKDETTELDLLYFKRFVDSISPIPSRSTDTTITNGNGDVSAEASSCLDSGPGSGLRLAAGGRLTESSNLPSSKQLMKYLLEELPWYRVKYTVRGININTPRYTTVFGKDSTDIPWTGYQKCKPRAIPEVLVNLMRKVEQVTSSQFNFCLVNYYSNGDDSISYHSDSESFLGPNPTIASLSLGASRDFFLRHVNHKHHPRTGKPVPTEKFELEDGDMVVMRGRTQHEWMHSIPKRKNARGRINITFRKGVVRYATENYNQYNVGKGPMYRWDREKQVMVEAEA
ncbi:hypothetical protein I316_01679 [Kwoniella heveanensis BCC8398]|uniref:Fe2OG dioxygenase domain-containing protein n=1 Tax=Kwoniella heveanensis BCC8398 TaxID=1296120 RepID=A0A1B9GZI5_9TREE|nr:hypothetical protein I316_01679 [Kwoniella heveanensis BCC8398]